MEKDYYDIAQSISKGLLFLDVEDIRLYDACESLFRYIWERNRDVRGVLALCALNERKNNNVPSLDLHDLIYDAATKNGHPDAVVYYCLCVMRNLPINTAVDKIARLRGALRSKNATDIALLFEACARWSNKDFDGYCDGIASFFARKSSDFNPYMAIPAGSVWLSSAAPAKVQNGIFGDLKTRKISTKVDYIISASCDSNYFNTYGDIFIESLRRLDENFYCHISIADSVDFSIQDERFAIVCQDIPVSDNIGPISSALRYLHAGSFLEDAKNPVVVVDFDVAFRCGMSGLIDFVGERDVGLRCLSNVLPWETITAGFSVFNPTDRARDFLRTMHAYFMNTLRLDGRQWWIDQNALECALRFSEEAFESINVLGELDRYALIPTGPAEAKLRRLRAVLE